MRNDYFLVINERKKQLQDHKDNKIFNVCSMWGRRLDWWRGNRDIRGMEHHFKDYSKEKSQQPTLWENPGEEYLFQSFEENKPKPVQSTPTQQDDGLSISITPDISAMSISSSLQSDRVQITTQVEVTVAGDEYYEDYEEEEEYEEIKEETPSTASALRRGDKIEIDGKILSVLDMSSSKTGKHGSSKIHFVGMDASGKKVESIMESKNIVTKVRIDRRLKERYFEDVPTPAPQAQQQKQQEEKKPKDDKKAPQKQTSYNRRAPVPTKKDEEPEKIDAQVSSLRKGDTIMQDGKTLRLLDIASSKTGKHGSTKIHFVAINEQGEKIEKIMRATDTLEKVSKSLSTTGKQVPETKTVQVPSYSFKTSPEVLVENSLPGEYLVPSYTQDHQMNDYFGEVQIHPCKRDSDWLQAIKAVAKGNTALEFYKAYLNVRERYALYFGFFFDVAEELFDIGSPYLGFRVLSNICELNLENPNMMRILASKLSQYEQYTTTSQKVLEQILYIRPEEPQSYRDLALVLCHKEQLERAAQLLNKIIKGIWPKMKYERYNQVEVITLMDLNNIIERIKQHNFGTSNRLDHSFVDDRVISHTPVDIRIVMQWYDKSDIELHVVDPNGEECYSFHNTTKIGGLMSVDCPCYGPEEYLIRYAVRGKYEIYAKMFFANSNPFSGTVVSMTIYLRFGQKEEKQFSTTFALRKSKEKLHIATLNIF
eukprot:TRINITY_DN5886_c0_g1_i4.p1 TRINITY_DN5886_c0_g1~~TRINITY_DN5886_c0_g1_i4.p1  ORF type:complete len:708 (+),score=204.61 TRINITY_DN5886_c0_g1_i4:669-2792(+)